VSLAESPLQEGLVYVGTDDGLIQITEDGGTTWEKKDGFGKTPDGSYVSSIIASVHDANTAYATFDNHKKGDFVPYVMKSTNRGGGWDDISGDLPIRGTAYSIAEDHVDPNLLFVGTEFGVFFTRDGGDHWAQLQGGIPTIACRDLEIQRRENDLVVGTFGRGIWVLDDYSPLREVTEEMLSQDEGVLLGVKDAWLYVQSTPLGGKGKSSQGDAFYVADNPPYGAVFTYFLKDGYQTRREERRDAEKEIQKDGGDNPYPSWDELRAEDREQDPQLILVVSDETGDVTQRLTGPVEKGFHRVAWNLRLPAPHPARTNPWTPNAPWDSAPQGPLVVPGTYTVTMYKKVRGEIAALGAAQTFEVTPLDGVTLVAADRSAALAFQKRTAELRRAVMGAVRYMNQVQGQLDHIQMALRDTPGATQQMMNTADGLEIALDDIRVKLTGDRTISSRYQPTPPSINSRVSRITWGWDSTSAPTQTHHDSYGVAAEEFGEALAALQQLAETDLAGLETQMEALGAPYTPGRLPKWNP